MTSTVDAVLSGGQGRVAKLILIMMVLVPAAATAGTAGGRQPVGVQAPVGMAWQLEFADEFDGNSLNDSVWRAYHSTYGDGNFELQCYRPENALVSGGTLKLRALEQEYTCPSWSNSLGFATPHRQYTSAFLGTRENGVYFPRYGYYEARMKIPRQRGLWPAFWLRHRDGSNVVEIDVMEAFPGEAPNGIVSTLHYTPRANVWKGYRSIGSAALPPQWLTLGVAILPVADQVQIAFYHDGQLVQRTSGLVTGTPFDTGMSGGGSTFSTEPFGRHPGQGLFDIALNLAVGGFSAGNPDDDAQTWFCHWNASWVTVAAPADAPAGASVIQRLMQMADGSWRHRACTQPAPVGAGGVAPSFPVEFEIDHVRVWSLVDDRLFVDGFELP